MKHSPPFVVLVLALGLAGCSASSSAVREGREASRRGDLDEAVALLERAASAKPDDIEIRITLMNARLDASRFHLDQARKDLASDSLERGAAELERAVALDPTNDYAREQLAEVRRRLEGDENTKTVPPRGQAPGTLINLKFEDTSLRIVLETLAKMAGVDILFDEAYRDRRVSVDLKGVTFTEALGLLTRTHGLFYKVESSSAVTVGDGLER